MKKLEYIARIHTDFPTKFGIPRQSGLVSTKGTIVFEPEYRKEGEREGNEHGGDVSRHGHEAQIDQLFVDQEIIDQKITSPPEHDVRTPADGIAEHLPGYDRGNGPQIEQVDRPDDPIGKTHQRAV